jgi:diadenosine tetraphosphatase ApaH/serine/threonine PP2A family protein phosphatase
LKHEYQKAIAELNFLHITSDATLAHGSPDQPEEFHYLFSVADARPSFRAFQTPLCFVGHTHIPSLFMESAFSMDYLPPGLYPLKKDERYILNPGSVGQPRDRDPRLALGIFDDEKWTFELVRLEYDNRKAAQKIRKAGLPDFLAARLL